MIKKIICFLTQSHKHLEVGEKVSPETQKVICVRCNNQFIYYEKVGVYKKWTKGLERTHEILKESEKDLELIKNGQYKVLN